MNAQSLIKHYSELGLFINNQLSKIQYTYSILDNDSFAQLKDKPIELQAIYWQEMLQRAHWAALSSLLRNLKWISAITSSMTENNFLSLAANLRCLIESCADTFHALQAVAPTLAENNQRINSLIGSNPENDKCFFVAPEIEQSLIHFSYARRITKAEKSAEETIPEYHNAKSASEYLKILDQTSENGPTSQLYSWLCQFTHPASHSSLYLFETKYSDTTYKFRYLDRPDEKYIANMFKEFNQEITNALMLGMNPSLLLLKTLNLFNYDSVKSPFVDNIDLSELKSWQKISAKFRTV